MIANNAANPQVLILNYIRERTKISFVANPYAYDIIHFYAKKFLFITRKKTAASHRIQPSPIFRFRFWFFFPYFSVSGSMVVFMAAETPPRSPLRDPDITGILFLSRHNFSLIRSY